MKSLITKKEAREFKRRWKAVNEFEIQELRKTPPAKKLLQLSALMASVKAFPGWDEALKDINDGKNLSPAFDNADDAIAYLKKNAS